jgi:hypothetical protein
MEEFDRWTWTKKTLGDASYQLDEARFYIKLADYQGTDERERVRTHLVNARKEIDEALSLLAPAARGDGGLPPC